MLFHQLLRVWVCDPGARAGLPDASLCLADILLGLGLLRAMVVHCVRVWCVVCACTLSLTCRCTHTSVSLSTSGQYCCLPWALSPHLVAMGAAGPRTCPHMVRVAFHSLVLINVCPLPALSRGILVMPGTRLTPSS